jgi:hypothetical protein
MWGSWLSFLFVLLMFCIPLVIAGCIVTVLLLGSIAAGWTFGGRNELSPDSNLCFSAGERIGTYRDASRRFALTVTARPMKAPAGGPAATIVRWDV